MRFNGRNMDRKLLLKRGGLSMGFHLARIGVSYFARGVLPLWQ